VLQVRLEVLEPLDNLDFPDSQVPPEPQVSLDRLVSQETQEPPATLGPQEAQVA